MSDTAVAAPPVSAPSAAPASNGAFVPDTVFTPAQKAAIQDIQAAQAGHERESQSERPQDAFAAARERQDAIVASQIAKYMKQAEAPPAAAADATAQGAPPANGVTPQNPAAPVDIQKPSLADVARACLSADPQIRARGEFFANKFYAAENLIPPAPEPAPQVVDPAVAKQQAADADLAFRRGIYDEFVQAYTTTEVETNPENGEERRYINKSSFQPFPDQPNYRPEHRVQLLQAIENRTLARTLAAREKAEREASENWERTYNERELPATINSFVDQFVQGEGRQLLNTGDGPKTSAEFFKFRGQIDPVLLGEYQNAAVAVRNTPQFAKLNQAYVSAPTDSDRSFARQAMADFVQLAALKTAEQSPRWKYQKELHASLTPASAPVPPALGNPQQASQASPSAPAPDQRMGHAQAPPQSLLTPPNGAMSAPPAQGPDRRSAIKNWLNSKNGRDIGSFTDGLAAAGMTLDQAMAPRTAQ